MTMNTSDSSTTADASTTAEPSAQPLRHSIRRVPKWLWRSLAILLVGGVGFALWKFVFHKDALPTPPPPPVATKAETIESVQVVSSSEFVGTLEAQERVSLQPQIQGRVDRVFVASGDRVTKGTPIVSLSLDQAQAQVAGAVAAANSSRAAVGTAEAQSQVAEAQQAKAAADVKLQQVQFNRTRRLVAVGALAKQELDIAQNSRDTAIATLNASKKQVNAANASVGQAQSNLQQAQANTASNQVNLNQKQVVSPISGVIGDFSFKAGDYVSTGQTLTTITKNTVLDMRISVPSNQLSQLRLGLPVELIDPNTSKRIARGSVNFISPQVKTDAQSILIKARFDNPESKLRDGQYAQAKIVWNQKPGLLIPTTAVSRIGGQNFVFVVEADQSQKTPNQPQKTQLVAHQRPVKLGDLQGAQYPVLEGIKPGDQIALSNILKLRDNTPVQLER